jgi:long-chain acyl-CoA synthetase
MGEIWSGTRRLDGAALMERASRAARGFEALGLKAGDTVALYLRNDFPLFEASFAAALIGAYPVPVNWHYVEDEARYLFENSGAKLIIIHADLIEPIRAALPKGVPVLVVPTPAEIQAAYGLPDDRIGVPAGMTAWADWLENFEPLPPRALEAPGTIIYTSGTTGRPKGVKRDAPTPEQAALLNGVLARGFGFAPGDPSKIVTVVAGPMYHAAPSAYGLAAARLGGTVLLQPRFDAEDLLRLIETRRVTHIHMVPIMFTRLLKLPDTVRSTYDLSSLRYIIHAAAPCPPPVKRAMIEWWGPIINEYYGSTETGMVTFCTAAEYLAHIGTFGRALAEASVRVIDGEGRDLPARGIGEVICRIRSVADFTYHGDDAKRRATEKQGLITLGDVGYLDEDGFLYLCDRARDMVISGGVNIYPAEIEAELHKMPGIADCGVFGIPDEEFGEAICAAIQPMPDSGLTAADVLTFLKGKVSGYKLPRRVDFHDLLPREDSGKIFKRKLREPYWEGLDRRI